MNSPILFEWMRPLGWALMHFIWQGTVIAFLLAAALTFMRRTKPCARGTAAMIALLAMAVCPVVTALHYRHGRAASAADASESTNGAELLAPIPSARLLLEPVESPDGMDAVQNSRTRSPAPFVHPPEAAAIYSRAGIERQIVRIMPWGVWVWIGGVTLLALWRLGGWMLVGRWMRHDVSPVPPRWAAALTELVRQTGLRRPVRLIASLRLAVPVTAGWLRPAILFPASLLSGLPPRHVEALLAHELAHIRRMDYLVNLAQTILETLLFYHPAVWWTGRIIRQEREHCCDDAAVAIHGDVNDYATALAGLAGGQSSSLLPAAKGGSMLLRLRRLLAPQSAPGPALRIPASMAAAGAALGLAFLLVNPPPGVARMKSAATDERPVPSAPAEQTPPESANESSPPEKPAEVKPVPVPTAVAARGRILDRNGVALANNDTNGNRVYPWGALAAHAVGWSGTGGKSGTEAKFEKTLSQGTDVSLTLDVRLQLIAEQCMEEAGVGRGTAVVIDPENGDIRAMASLPNFDPGLFEAGEKNAAQIADLRKDPAQPVLNRAVQQDSPGSVYKIVTAIAAYRAGLVKQYNCPGFIDYGRRFACWIYPQQQGKHGILDLTGALKQSCNCWFFQAGNAMGIDHLAETARLLGMDAVFTDIDGSRPVIVPDKKWWAAERGTPWTAAETAHCSIGMGFVQESPVHLASLAATVANGGDVWKPRLSMNTPAERTQNRVLPANQMEVVRNGMRVVVNDAKGTGKNAQSLQFTIAGKTGTAQKNRFENGKHVDDYRAWFIGFAPYESPRFAICVLVENGQTGGKTAAPIAKTILEQAMALKEGQPAPAPQRRAPMQGHFRIPERVPN